MTTGSPPTPAPPPLLCLVLHSSLVVSFSSLTLFPNRKSLPHKVLILFSFSIIFKWVNLQFFYVTLQFALCKTNLSVLSIDSGRMGNSL